MNPGDPRDRALEALLGGRGRAGRATGRCLDAETLAAYADGGLDPPARDAAEAHMAGCARCQAVMATIATTSGEPQPTPAHAANRAWWQIDRRWLMPLAGAAAAVLLWMVVPTRDPGPQRASLDDRPAAIEPAAESPSPNRGAPGAAAPLASEGRATVPASPPVAEKKLAATPASEAVARQADLSARERAEADTVLRANEAARAGADLLAKAEDRTGPVAAATPAAPTATQEARVQTVGPAAGPLAAAQAPGQADQSPAPVGAEWRTLDSSVRWRLAGPGGVERSTNGGASWDRLDTGVRTPLRSGVCPSASTCWIVGDAGVVLLTTDAHTWRRVTSPASEDLVAIEAADGAIAVVHTASGQRFRTSDGGTTWTPAP